MITFSDWRVREEQKKKNISHDDDNQSKQVCPITFGKVGISRDFFFGGDTNN